MKYIILALLILWPFTTSANNIISALKTAKQGYQTAQHYDNYINTPTNLFVLKEQIHAFYYSAGEDYSSLNNALLYKLNFLDQNDKNKSRIIVMPEKWNNEENMGFSISLTEVNKDKCESILKTEWLTNNFEIIFLNDRNLKENSFPNLCIGNKWFGFGAGSNTYKFITY